ncbi:MAG: sigma 54-interacting transcriptional regulator [Ignavibacteriaceae bacterium]
MNDVLNIEVLNSIAEGVITVDKNFKINFANNAVETITGYTKDEITGQFCKYVLKCELCSTKCPIAIVLETGKDLFDYPSVIEIKSGMKKPVKLNAAILKNSDNEPVGGVISFRDLSEMEKIRLETEKVSDFRGIIGHSKPMQEIFTLIQDISDSDATILILGESGTGKEMIANAIHASSLRKDKPFFKVNCSVLPSNLLASELFGHVKGAFTDAVRDRPGRFELAHNGTIFLDEVAEMPLQTQLQLLRVLQEGTYERVGESITRRVDVRVIAATNADIEDALKSGKLREDLFYRLNVIPIHVPPVRERKEDIPLLVNYFMRLFADLYKKNIQNISTEALDILMEYNWPGNVREIENVIEYAVVRTRNNSVLSEISLPASFNLYPKTHLQKPVKTFRNANSAELLSMLEKYRWNKTKVAQELGIGRTTLWRLMKKYNLNK